MYFLQFLSSPPIFFSQWLYFSRWTFTIFCCRIIFASSLLVFGEYLDHRVRYTGEATRQCVCSVLLAMLRLRAACGRALCFRCSPSPLQPFTSAFPLLLICRLLAQIPWSLKLDIKASSRSGSYAGKDGCIAGNKQTRKNAAACQSDCKHELCIALFFDKCCNTNRLFSLDTDLSRAVVMLLGCCGMLYRFSRGLSIQLGHISFPVFVELVWIQQTQENQCALAMLLNNKNYVVNNIAAKWDAH